MERYRFIRSAAIILAGLFCAVTESAALAPPEILVLSNRADLISGGDALVQINLAPGVPTNAYKVFLNGALVNSMFAMRPNGHLQGVVTGLVNGDNLLIVRSVLGNAQITITNHPIGGPVFSGGGQLAPWICATQVATTVSVTAPDDPSLTGTTLTKTNGLSSDPVDFQCNTAIEYLYYYYPQTKVGTGCTLGITGANPCYVAYDPASRPTDALIADFTNDRGDTAKNMLRVERGTINRAVYQIVAFFDPAQPSAPWAPQKAWNGKLIWGMGASTSANHFEQTVAANFDQNALTRGFMTATSMLTQHGVNNNELTAAETIMMVKEHITEVYGPIRYTISNGCSGGSMMQTSPASIVPGLLNGLQPTCSYPDAPSTWIETTDCGLLAGHYFLTPNGSALTDPEKAAITGHPNLSGGGAAYCNTWVASFINPQLPNIANNCGSGFPAGIVYDAALRPKGVRCSIHDIQVNQWGRFVDTDGNTKTRLPYDNDGVQYGLKALASGSISPETFVRLNEGVGSYGNDLVWSGGSNAIPTIPAPRHVAQTDVLPTLYTSGIVTDGKHLAQAAIIDLRGFNLAPCIHMPWRSFSERDRLDRANGTHGNQVIRMFNSGIVPGAGAVSQSFDMIDRWLTNVESDPSPTTLEQKIINNKPADVHDVCFNNNGATAANVDVSQEVPLTSPACTVGPVALAMKSPHIVAGGPLAENVFKCQLKPLNLLDADYNGAFFDAGQQARLAAVFPNGVCDWTRPGVGQTDAVLTTFENGPGGVPLGPAPVSSVFP
jgi:hypothetical protein